MCRPTQTSSSAPNSRACRPARAFLAFSTDEVRENLLEILRSRTDEEGERSRDTRTVQEMIQLTRKRGYGQNLGELQEEPKFGAVAVPLCHQGRVLVCLNIVFLLRAVKDKQAQHKIVAEILHTRKLIEERFGMRG
ncbi:hypothetical protein E1J61_18245 [Cupriavidus sp. L7L]|nr:hypothetical protein E1J61_18245 [Cupriavidus sp. L7L]